MNYISFLYCLLFFFLQSALGQEIVFSARNFEDRITYATVEAQEKSLKKLNDSWKMYTTKFADTLILDFQYGRHLAYFMVSDDFNNMSYQRFEKNTNTYANYLGSYGTSINRFFVFSKNANHEFLVIHNNSLTKKTEESILDFKLKDRKYLCHFVQNGKFWILAWKKFSRIFTLYELGDDLKFSTHDIDLAKGKFYIDGNLSPFPPRSRSRDSIISIAPPRYLVEIKSDVPNTNKVVTKANKLYVTENNIVFTFDVERNHTTAVQFNMTSFESTTHLVSKTRNDQSESYNEKTNSYLIDSLLFFVVANKKSFDLGVFDIKNRKKHTLPSFDKKSPYLEKQNLIVSQDAIIKYGLENQVNEKEETIQKKLRKIAKQENDIGLRIIPYQNSFHVSLGGYVETNNAAAYAPLFQGAIGGLIMGTFGYFGSFIRDESLEVFIDKNSFDTSYYENTTPYNKIEAFLNKISKDQGEDKIKWITRFNMGQAHYLGYFESKSRTYYIRKFN